MIVTFYSFKGGVGRSMALANVAEVLADLGYPVIVCDWDLEAPGLEHYFLPEAEARTWRAQPGIIDLVEEYRRAVAEPKTAPGTRASEEEAAQFTTLGKLVLRRPTSLAKLVPGSARSSGGSIRLLTAGRRDGDWGARYNQAVRDADWSDFYERWAGGAYFEFLRGDLESEAKIVLIDSRTGVTELGGVSTHQLSDLVFLCSAANAQNLQGTAWMAGILSDPRLREQRKDRPLAFIPIATRIDTLSETTLVTAFLTEFKNEFARFVPPALGDAHAFLQSSVIPYAGIFSFKETVVARASATLRHPLLYQPYEVMAHAVVRCGKAAQLLASHEPGPAPLSTGESVVAASSPPAREPARVPPGLFALAWSEPDRAAATALTAALREGGLTIWSDLSPGEHGSTAAEAWQVEAKLESCAGYLILVPRDFDSGWLDAEFNRALREQACREGFRVLVLLQDETQQTLGALKRLRTLPLPPVPAVAAAQIFTELLPPQTITPEPASALIFEQIKTPTERVSRFFLGRGADLAEATERIARALAGGDARLAITGPSGCGRSTFLRVGLAPLFQRGLFGTARRPWRVAFVAVERDADSCAALQRAVAGALGLGEIIGHELSRLAVTAEQPLAILIDNYDRLAADRGAAEFERLLTELRARPAGCFLALSVSLPLDGATPPALDPAVAIQTLAPLNAAGIRQFLDGAARLLGVHYEPGLIEPIAADAARLGTSVRTLANVLHRLHERRTDAGVLTHVAYRDFGGAEGVLLEHATALLTRLAPQIKSAARLIATSLVHGRNGALLSRTREEILAPITLHPRPGWSVLKIFKTTDEALPVDTTRAPDPQQEAAFRALLEANLLVIGKDSSVRLASPALTTLSEVRAWIEADAEIMRWRADLEDAAERWAANGRPSEFLPDSSLVRSRERLRLVSPAAQEAALATSRKMVARIKRNAGYVLAAYTVFFILFLVVMQIWNRYRFGGDAEELQIRLQAADAQRMSFEKQVDSALESARAANERATRAEEKLKALSPPPNNAAPPPQSDAAPPDPRFDNAIAALASDDEKARLSAIGQLTESRQISRLAQLIEGKMNATDPTSVRLVQGAAQALRYVSGRFPLSPTEAATMVRLLASPDLKTRDHAVAFLSGLNDPDGLRNAFRALVDFVSKRLSGATDDAEDRGVYNAVVVLGEWARTLDISILNTTLHGPLYAEVRNKLSEFMEQFGADSARWKLTLATARDLLAKAPLRSPAPRPAAEASAR